jgi:hypothetical protein
MTKTKKTTPVISQLKKLYDNREVISNALIDAANRIWTIIVLFALWISAFVIYQYAQEAPRAIRFVLVSTLFSLGLMWLVKNLSRRAMVK